MDVSKPFETRNGVQQDCLLISTLLFKLFFAASKTCFLYSQRRYIPKYKHRRLLFNPSRLKSMTKVKKNALTRGMMCADDTIVAAHRTFYLWWIVLISLKNKFSSTSNHIAINNKLEVVNEFTHFESIMSDKEVELVGQHLILRASVRVWRKFADSRPRPRFQCLTLVFLVLFLLKRNPVQRMLTKSID